MNSPLMDQARLGWKEPIWVIQVAFSSCQKLRGCKSSRTDSLGRQWNNEMMVQEMQRTKKENEK